MKRWARWIFFSALSGTLAGVSATIFLYLLDIVTRYRFGHPQIIWFLPLAGLAIGWSFHRYGREILPGTNLVLDEIHDPKKVIPARMAPFILLGTVLTHLFGGSAGREGTAVQMGASLSDQISRIFRVENEERRILLMTGAGAGFGAAIGAPFAGVIFGMEVLRSGRLRWTAVIESLIAGLFGYGTAALLRAPHSRFPHLPFPAFQIRDLLAVILVGTACGVFANGFIRLTHVFEALLQRWIKRPELKPFFAGIVLALLFQIPGAIQYAGLGIEYIQAGLMGSAPPSEPFIKAFFTALTIGSGFKGGEFIPLVFMGTTLGCAMGVIVQASYGLTAAVGFAALFGAAAHTPIACTVMAMEIFGPGIGIYAFIACFVAYLCSGQVSIYKNQRRSSKMWFLKWS